MRWEFVMDLDFELEKIIKKFSIDIITKDDCEVQKRVEAIGKFFAELEGKIALIALKEEDLLHIENFINDECDVEEFLFREDQLSVADGIEWKGAYDKVVLCSYHRREEWYWHLSRQCESKKVIDIYDYLLKSGFNCKAEFYKKGFFAENVYAEIFYDKKKYEQTDDDEIKEIYLRKLICDSIFIRDLHYAELYIEEYVQKGYRERERYIQFWKEVQDLLDNVKQKIAERKTYNIIWNWIDSLRYKDIAHMEYLSSIVEDSAFFENAYTVVPWTAQTYSVLFLEKKPIDDDYSLYRNEKFGYQNSRLLKCIKDNGYTFKRYGDAYCEKYFGTGEETKPLCRDYSELNHPIKGYRANVCTYIFWQAVCQVVKEDKPCFILRHCICETHYPFISGNLTEDYMDSPVGTKQIIPSMQYVDTQLKYYDQFLGRKDISVYMSDHGQLDEKYHTVFMIRGGEVKPQKYNGMFSYINFSKLMCRIINKDFEWNDLFGDYVEIQDSDAYGKRGSLSESAKRVWNRNSIFGYKAIRTESEMFVKRNDGKEYYYKFPCIFNQIDQPSYSARIDYFKELIGDKKIDIFKNEFFSKVQIFYKAIPFADKRNAALKTLIDEKLERLFNSLPNGKKIAFRCGGEHTWELIKMIPDQNKVQYIIDKKVDVATRIQGYQYIVPDEMLKAKIDVVILSSFQYLQEIREEMEKYTGQIEVIDIYKYLENNGIRMSKAFYETDDITMEDIERAKMVSMNV